METILFHALHVFLVACGSATIAQPGTLTATPIATPTQPPAQIWHALRMFTDTSEHHAERFITPAERCMVWEEPIPSTVAPATVEGMYASAGTLIGLVTAVQANTSDSIYILYALPGSFSLRIGADTIHYTIGVQGVKERNGSLSPGDPRAAQYLLGL